MNREAQHRAIKNAASAATRNVFSGCMVASDLTGKGAFKLAEVLAGAAVGAVSYALECSKADSLDTMNHEELHAVLLSDHNWLAPYDIETIDLKKLIKECWKENPNESMFLDLGARVEQASHKVAENLPSAMESQESKEVITVYSEYADPEYQGELVLSNEYAREEQILKSNGTNCKVVDIKTGSVIDTVLMELAAGVHIKKSESLERDFGLKKGQQATLIQNYGDGLSAIQLPAKYRKKTFFRDVVKSEEWANLFEEKEVPMLLGIYPDGSLYVIDLDGAPHLLISSQTGGGKSVFLNQVISSIMYGKSPKEVKFLMIDPKLVELSVYEDCKHLLRPVITDMEEAAIALDSLVDDMNARYTELATERARNITGYNKKVNARRKDFMKKIKGLSDDKKDKLIKIARAEGIVKDPMVRIVGVAEEVADALATETEIIMGKDIYGEDNVTTVSKSISKSIERLAQKARACGILLILVTQRPSAGVLSELIRANVPSRICLQVGTHQESKSALGFVGAEKLLGQGDFYFRYAGEPFVTRGHGSLIEDEEVEQLIEEINNKWRLAA